MHEQKITSYTTNRKVSLGSWGREKAENGSPSIFSVCDNCIAILGLHFYMNTSVVKELLRAKK